MDGVLYLEGAQSMSVMGKLVKAMSTLQTMPTRSALAKTVESACTDTIADEDSNN